MDWRTRMAAIVLAGGSVAGCAGADDPGDAGTFVPPPLASADSQPAAVVVGPAPTIQVDRVLVSGTAALGDERIVRRTSSSETGSR